MYELVHQLAPESPAARTAIAIVASLFGVPVSVLGLMGVTGFATATVTLVLTFLLVGVVSLSVAGCLTLGVVRQANAAPDATPLTEPRTESDDDAETPIQTLRQRYADGQLSDEEFNRQLDTLLETEDTDRRHPERERVLE